MSNIENFTIACPEQVRQRVEFLKNRSFDIKSRLGPHLKKLWNPKRELKIVDDPNVFKDLYSRFPNFSDVINFYEVNAIASSKMKLAFEAMPVLLHGEPGLGKTYFVSELSKALGLQFHEIGMATVTAKFAISGGSIQWYEGSVGLVAEALIHSKHANPMILIDEIDKAGRLSQYDPLAPFFSLLENHSARRFKDEALEVELDASKIIWVATSNDLAQIPEPILSRMQVFEIGSPSTDQNRKVIESIYNKLRSSLSYGRLLTDSMPDSITELLLHQTPREIQKSLTIGAMCAVKANRNHIQIQDLPLRKEVRRVGFI